MTQAGVYSENKLCWWYAREQQLPDAPKQVQLILSDMCNQSCRFCAYRQDGYTSNELFMGDSELAATGQNNPKRWIPTERALSLLDEFKELGVLSVQFTGGGEPTVHPEHERIFRRALELGLRCSLVSNGVAWRASLINEVLHRFDWVRVSIDSADPETYRRTRQAPAAHWSRAWESVGMLARRIKAVGSPCVLGLGFVVTPESRHEIVEFAELARDSGVQNVRYTAMFSTEDEKPFAGIYDEIRGQIAGARVFETDSFRIYDNFGSRVDDLRQHAPDYKLCPYQYYTTYIGGDLRSYRCCVYAYNHRGLVDCGDLSQRSFAEFWRSQERRDDMARLDARECERCQFQTKNRSLLYVMGNTESDTVSRHLEWP